MEIHSYQSGYLDTNFISHQVLVPIIKHYSRFFKLIYKITKMCPAKTSSISCAYIQQEHYYKSKSLLQRNTVQGLSGNGGTSCKNQRNCQQPPCPLFCNESPLSRLVRRFLLSRVLEPSGRLMPPIHYSLDEYPSDKYHYIRCRLLRHELEAPFFQRSTEKRFGLQGCISTNLDHRFLLPPKCFGPR